MRKIFVAALALIFSAGIALAQESLPGLPTRDEAQIGASYKAQNFGAWEKRCVKLDEGEEPCQLYQLLVEENGNPVAEITLMPLVHDENNPASVAASVLVPLEVLLTANMIISIDDKVSKVYPYLTCTISGCMSRIGFLPEEEAHLRASETAYLTIVPAATPNERAVLEIDLNGFSAGIDSITPQ